MNLSILRADARFFVFGDETNTQYSDTNIDRNINNWYEYGIAIAMEHDGDWQVNGEIATTDIVAGQREYIVPTDILRINELYIKSTGSGTYVKAVQRDPINVDREPESYNPGTPEFDLLDNSIFIYIPETSITGVTAGLKIHYQTDLTALSLTTDTPNLSKPFQRLLSLGAAYDYCNANEMWNKAKSLRNELVVCEQKMIDYYGGRSTVRRRNFSPKNENYK